MFAATAAYKSVAHSSKLTLIKIIKVGSFKLFLNKSARAHAGLHHHRSLHPPMTFLSGFSSSVTDGGALCASASVMLAVRLRHFHPFPPPLLETFLLLPLLLRWVSRPVASWTSHYCPLLDVNLIFLQIVIDPGANIKITHTHTHIYIIYIYIYIYIYHYIYIIHNISLGGL